MPMLLSDFVLFSFVVVVADRWTFTRDCQFARLVGRNGSRVVRFAYRAQNPATVYVAPGGVLHFLTAARSHAWPARSAAEFRASEIVIKKPGRAGAFRS
jgi:hypothetical protein